MTTSLRHVGQHCLHIDGTLDVRRDVLSTAGGQQPFTSLREALEHIRLTRCPPAAPAHVRVTNVASDRIEVSWSDQSDNESGFRVRYHEDPGDEVRTESTGPGGTHVTLQRGIRPSRRYAIGVRSFNAAGESPPEWIAAFTPEPASPSQPTPPEPPPEPFAVTASAVRIYNCSVGPVTVLLRNLTANGPWGPLTESPPNDCHTSVLVGQLAPPTGMHIWELRAYDGPVTIADLEASLARYQRRIFARADAPEVRITIEFS